ncbi:MAG: AI-2E family transporter [Lawsonibacter sp.]|jgi:sporulation integral membrane protein YtvI|nr:AI-2E family transporter [Lawsonibacter sp.]
MTQKQLTWRQRGALWLRLSIRLLLFAAGCFAVLMFGRPLLALCAPFAFALAAAALLNPLIKALQRALGWSRQLVSAALLLLLFALVGGGLALLAYAAVGQAVSLVQNWSGLLDSLQAALDQLESLFAQLLALAPPQLTQLAENAGGQLFQWLYQVVPDALASLGLEAGERAMGLPSFLMALVIFIMATFLLTADYPYLRSRAVQHMDEGLLRFLSQVRATALGAFGGYLKAEFLLSVGVFFILLAGFFLMGQPYGLLLSLGLAVMDFIPVIGAGTVMVPWAFVALFTRDFSNAAWLMGIWGVIALFRRVMEPKFVGDQTGLPPILSLVSIYVGMKLAGVLGMILGPVALLILLNLAGMGCFQGLALDLRAAAKDIAAILSQRPDSPQ